jgi:tetratricopeptide (TPR) repeat protein
MHTYTLRDAAALLGLSRTVILGLVASGYVNPARGPRREYRFSFPDMVLLRAAQGLQAAQIPQRRIVRSLRRLRESLPARMPLSGLRIAAIGNEVVVRDGGAPWQAETGQLLFDFDVAPAPGAVHDLRLGPPARPASAAAPAPQRQERGRDLPNAARGPAREPAKEPANEPAKGPAKGPAEAGAAVDWFRRALALEGRDRAAAAAAYRPAIAAAPGRADAYLNLGVLLGEAGRHAEAAAVYRRGLRHCPAEPLLHFNLGVALEDLRRLDDAAQAYEACLALDPAQADAHFNLARLHDQAGRQRQAIRHYSAYRRLRQTTGGGP